MIKNIYNTIYKLNRINLGHCINIITKFIKYFIKGRIIFKFKFKLAHLHKL